MITIREYLAFLTFLAVCVGGLTPIYRWWRKKEDAADEAARAARLAELERRSREEARSREISEERRYRSAFVRELRKAMDLPDGANTTGQPSPTASSGVEANGADVADGSPTDDPTELLLNEALGPALAPNGDGSSEKAPAVQGPAFRRGKIPEPDTPKITIFETEETRSKTRLCADRGIPHHPDSWALIVHFPPFESMANWPRPRAFGNRGYEWTKWVPFTEIPADAPERALEELEAWFLRLLKGEEQPTGGRLTYSCAEWEDYEEDPKTQGWRVLWLEPRGE